MRKENKNLDLSGMELESGVIILMEVEDYEEDEDFVDDVEVVLVDEEV